MIGLFSVFVALLASHFTRLDASVPIPVEAFSDGIKHYQNGMNVKDYPRYPVEDYESIAHNILLHQRSNGGWPSNWDPLRILSEEEKRRIGREKDKKDTTFDNRATYPQVAYLAEVYNRTGNSIYKESVLRGLDFIYTAQYPSDGWPHSYPDTENYRPHITFMDDVMVGILATLRKAAAGEAPFSFLDLAQRDQAAAAVQRGDACILNLQIRVDDVLTAWAGQYDRHTLEPTTARSYELPSIVSAESVSVVRYLMAIESPVPEIIHAIESAVAWFERSKILGLRVERVNIEPIRYEHHTADTDVVVVEDADAPPLWARFYEIETNRPFMANRDGSKVYALSEVEHERRTGYAWYTGVPNALLERDYPAWRKRVAQ